MIQKKDDFVIDMNSSFAQRKFSVKTENLAHLFDIMRNYIYSNKILAVIREYSTNAIDANIKNNFASRPISITLPTYFEPTFSVRDYGAGLSEEEIFGIYSSYGESTKRESNEYIGNLGIGSKSGFAYSDSFTITSFHNGTKKIYEAFIDESQIGTIAKIHEEKNDSESGLLISISVNKNDINYFKIEAEKFFMWWDVTPEFIGVQPDFMSQFSTYKNEYSSSICQIFSKRYSETSISVKMGNILYPVTNFDKIDCDWLKGMFVVIKVGLGEVSHSASRESLEMNSLTVDTINTYLQKIRETLTAHFLKKIDDCKTPWNAIIEYHNMSFFAQQTIGKKISWKGKTLSTQLPSHFEYCFFDTYYKKWKKNVTVRYSTGDSVAFILNDGGFPASQTRARLLAARDKLNKTNLYTSIIYIKGSISDTNDLLKSDELIGSNYVKLSTVLAIPTKNKSKKAVAGKILEWNCTTAFPYSTCWDSVDIPDSDEEMIYVEIEKFVPVMSNFNNNSRARFYDLRNCLNLIRDVDNKVFKIYGVKAGQKLPKNFISLHDYMERMIVKFIKTDDFVDSYVQHAINQFNLRTSFLSSARTLMQTFDTDLMNKFNDVKCEKLKATFYFTKPMMNKFYHLLTNIKNISFHFPKITTALSELDDLKDKRLKVWNQNKNYCLENYPMIEYHYSSTPMALIKMFEYVNSIYATQNTERHKKPIKISSKINV